MKVAYSESSHRATWRCRYRIEMSWTRQGGVERVRFVEGNYNCNHRTASIAIEAPRVIEAHILVYSCKQIFARVS